MNATCTLSPANQKIVDALLGHITDEEVGKTKAVILDCPGEVLVMATAFRVLAETTVDHAAFLDADDHHLNAEAARDRAATYKACYEQICEAFA